LPAPSQIAAIEPDLKPAAAPSSSGDKADAASKAASAERKATELAKYEPLQIEVDSGSGEVTGSLPKSGASSGTLWRDAAMVFALTLAALLALSATLLRRRRMQTLAVAHLPRGQTALPSFSRTSNARLERAAVHQQRDIPGTRLRLWDEDWLPATMSEALDVLGVDPTASRDTMKTTVTRLRRALHPDHAIDEEDRRLRERRLKQINVAWDIVSGKRRSLWLSRKPRSS
jgi:DnaJ-domain-containing protein 1